MITRRQSLAVATTLATTLALGACGDSSSTSKAASGPLKDVTVSSASGKAPAVTLEPKPLKVTETTRRVLKEGSGEVVKGDELVSLKYAIVNGTTGEAVEDNYVGSKPNLGLNLGESGLLPGLSKGLKGVKTGSQVLVAMPPKDAFGDNGNAGAKIKATDTVVFVFDVLSKVTPLAEATGTAIAPKAGLPTVKWVKGKPATITPPKTTAPTETVVQPLIQGSGPAVKKGQTVQVTYTGALWKDGKNFDSSFNRPPGTFEFPVGQGQVIKAWDSSVEGQKVGSRLLLVVPPKDGYGSKGADGISATDTLVFVVDILAAY
ncbi:MAG: FKBP-type peptidyl-prolyl cis-trans isomerase [Micrococcales bacterium]|nr:FKBP-type peptidyl-prolyl cis-trans isomerase [Micrococcales bacterium]